MRGLFSVSFCSKPIQTGATAKRLRAITSWSPSWVCMRSSCNNNHGIAMAPEFQARLGQMFSWIASLADGSGKLPHLGDCDNGRVELLMDDIAQSSLPAGERHSLRVGTLSRLASLLLPGTFHHQEPVSVLPESGIAILRRNEASVVFCAMPNGLRGKGSHSHCDKLSIIFRLGADEVFCDSGSRCYTRSAERRNLDRSTRVHNTLMIDEAEQNIFSADPRLLFQSGNEAAVSPDHDIRRRGARISSGLFEDRHSAPKDGRTGRALDAHHG